MEKNDDVDIDVNFKKNDDIFIDLNFLLSLIDQRYSNKLANFKDIRPDCPKDLIYVYENSCNYYLFQYLCNFLDIENKIKDLKDKYSEYSENIKAIDEIENDFNKIKKESLEIKNYSNELLKSLKEKFKKNKDIKYAKETYEKLCFGIIDDSIKHYINFKNKNNSIS